MRIGVLSDTRMASVPYGPHGLGRAAVDIARGLETLGHVVTLYGGAGSAWGGETKTHADETRRAWELKQDEQDVWIDLSHYHDLSQARKDWPVVNYILDLECPYRPPRAAVNTQFARRMFPGAKVVPLGIPVSNIPFNDADRCYLAYCAKIHPHKGYDLAMKVASVVDTPVYFAGENYSGQTIPNYRGVMTNDAQLYSFLGGAIALLSPYRKDAGGRVNLEAAACGTPVLCLDGTATMEHVAHCISGFVCATIDEMIEALDDVSLLDRARMRQWAADTHNVRFMACELARWCQAAADGEQW